jgi:hypothetical protein
MYGYETFIQSRDYIKLCYFGGEYCRMKCDTIYCGTSSPTFRRNVILRVVARTTKHLFASYCRVLGVIINPKHEAIHPSETL